MPVRDSQTEHLFHHQQTNVQFAHPCSFRLQPFCLCELPLWFAGVHRLSTRILWVNRIRASSSCAVHLSIRQRYLITSAKAGALERAASHPRHPTVWPYCRSSCSVRVYTCLQHISQGSGRLACCPQGHFSVLDRSSSGSSMNTNQTFSPMEMCSSLKRRTPDTRQFLASFRFADNNQRSGSSSSTSSSDRETL